MGHKKEHKKENKKKKDKKKEHKKDKKRKIEESSSSSESSDHAPSSKQRRLEEKLRQKASETPEERQARRLAKKQRKEDKEAEEKKLFGFTNESNPFGDPNLTKPFKWRSKLMADMKKGKIHKPHSKHELREKQLALRVEIEKVKERRVAREVELEQMEEMRLQVERDAMREQLAGWEEKEEQFHRNQAKERTKIRIREGREKPIDILAKNVHLTDGEMHFEGNVNLELTEPFKLFSGLGSKDLEELRGDIKLYLDMGQSGEYWNALLVICDDELDRVKHSSRTSYGLNQAFMKDIRAHLESKTERGLIQIEEQINKKLNSGSNVDMAYWEALLKMLPVFKSKAFLKDFHASLLKKRLRQLKDQHKKEVQQKREEEESESEEEENAGMVGEEGSYSPMLHAGDDEDAVDPEEDQRQLEAQRKVVLEQKKQEQLMGMVQSKSKQVEDAEVLAAVRAAGMNRFLMSGDEMFQKEASKGEDEDEETFNTELTTPTQTYWWHEKYRPRKPRFFNRVKTGFDWNKYNQTHYDKENPPPKTVQGYKFNIFYPDLIEPTKAPRYYVEDNEDSNEHCTIRFVAGPPYEDIAFKIVKKEWDLSHSRGFKCVFDKGVLHLHFNFRRYRYRR